LVLAQPVHGTQFNGKQEGKATTAHLTCAAPATVSRRVFAHAKPRFHLKPLDALKQAPGRWWRSHLSARIPANKVTCRKTGC